MTKLIKNKIIVLGFGRSGTTWLSDIISKAFGGLILFEPLHPKVLSNSKEIAYGKINEDKQSLQLIKHLNNVLENNNRSNWLLRNHIPYKIEEMGQDYFNLIWNYCRIIGFKSIRANHMIEWIYHNISKDIIFVTRHPCAVIASILRREKNGHKFWEFGWPRTYEIFINNTIYKDDTLHQFQTLEKEIINYEHKIAFMWAISHYIAIRSLNKLNIPILFFENFYKKPFEGVKILMDYLGVKKSIHPSHIYSPSMTTSKTLHGLKKNKEDLIKRGSVAFWDDIINEKLLDEIINIINEFEIDHYDNSGFPKSESIMSS